MSKANILELEINGHKVESIKYWGRIHMLKLIIEYKKVYNLNEGDDFEFFYYKDAKDNGKMDEGLVASIYYWEKKNGKIFQ